MKAHGKLLLVQRTKKNRSATDGLKFQDKNPCRQSLDIEIHRLPFRENLIFLGKRLGHSCIRLGIILVICFCLFPYLSMASDSERAQMFLAEIQSYIEEMDALLGSFPNAQSLEFSLLNDEELKNLSQAGWTFGWSHSYWSGSAGHQRAGYDDHLRIPSPSYYLWKEAQALNRILAQMSPLSSQTNDTAGVDIACERAFWQSFPQKKMDLTATMNLMRRTLLDEVLLKWQQIAKRNSLTWQARLTLSQKLNLAASLHWNSPEQASRLRAEAAQLDSNITSWKKESEVLNAQIDQNLATITEAVRQRIFQIPGDTDDLMRDRRITRAEAKNNISDFLQAIQDGHAKWVKVARQLSSAYDIAFTTFNQSLEEQVEAVRFNEKLAFMILSQLSQGYVDWLLDGLKNYSPTDKAKNLAAQGIKDALQAGLGKELDLFAETSNFTQKSSSKQPLVVQNFLMNYLDEIRDDLRAAIQSAKQKLPAATSCFWDYVNLDAQRQGHKNWLAGSLFEKAPPSFKSIDDMAIIMEVNMWAHWLRDCWSYTHRDPIWGDCRDFRTLGSKSRGRIWELGIETAAGLRRDSLTERILRPLNAFMEDKMTYQKPLYKWAEGYEPQSILSEVKK